MIIKIKINILVFIDAFSRSRFIPFKTQANKEARAN